MAETRNSDIQRRVLDEAKLQASVDIIPTQLTDKILPVLNVNPKGKTRIIKLLDAVQNNNTKGWVVPSGKKWKFLYGICSYTSNATAGNREFRFEVLDEDNFFVLSVSASAQTASTTEEYNIIPGSKDVSEIVAGRHHLGIPNNSIFLEGCIVWFYDFASISATDNLAILFYVEETDLLSEEYEKRIGATA